MAIPSELNVGLMGLGVVGGGVATALLDQADAISTKIGRPVNLKKVLVRDAAKTRNTYLPAGLLTTKPEDILSDSEIHIVVEVMGGTQPAAGYMKQALSAGKPVGYCQQRSYGQARRRTILLGQPERGKSTF